MTKYIEVDETTTGTTITLENENGVYSVHVDLEQMNIKEMADQLLFPVLSAAGYTSDTIRRILQVRY